MGTAPVQKNIEIIYQAKNNTTGLANVKAQVYLDGVAKAVGVNAITLTEVDATNSPGMYKLVIPAASITTWRGSGATPATSQFIEGWINSATASAPAPFRVEVTVASIDDIQATLGTPVGANVTADIAGVQTTATAIQGTVDSATFGNAAIKTAVDNVQTDVTTALGDLTTIGSNTASTNTVVTSATYGNAAIQTAVGGVQTDVTTIVNTVTSATYGNAAIKTELDTVNTNVNTAITDIGLVQTDTTQIISDVESATFGLAVIKSAIDAIQNNAGFAVPVPSQMVIPTAGSNTYRIPVTIYNDINALVDADSNTITVGLVNQAGTSRVAYLASTTMTRDSVGQYRVDVNIPSTAVTEELIFTFSYAIGGVNTARKCVTETVTEVAAAGLALQSTLLAVQATVDSATYGNAAIQTAIGSMQGDVTTILTDVGNLSTDLSAIEGTGFSTSTDSLHALRGYLDTYLYVGGRAI